MAVDVRSDGGRVHTGPPQLVFETRFSGREVRNTYVVTADGTRFLFVVPGEPAFRPTLTVLLDWK
jgi:hypothetical protein